MKWNFFLNSTYPFKKSYSIISLFNNGNMSGLKDKTVYRAIVSKMVYIVFISIESSELGESFRSALDKNAIL